MDAYRPSGEISRIGVGARAEAGTGGDVSCRSTFDIEALSGQADEEILKAWGLHVESAHAAVGTHELRGDLLARQVAELGGDQVLTRLQVGQAELGEDLRRGRDIGGAPR